MKKNGWVEQRAALEGGEKAFSIPEGTKNQHEEVRFGEGEAIFCCFCAVRTF
jgi:hypothetical protein